MNWVLTYCFIILSRTAFFSEVIMVENFVNKTAFFQRLHVALQAFWCLRMSSLVFFFTQPMENYWFCHLKLLRLCTGFSSWAWPLPFLDKHSTGKKYFLGLIDFMYKRVPWWVDYVLIINNHRLFRSHLIFDIARANWN